jgi:hypothetical protein
MGLKGGALESLVLILLSSFTRFVTVCQCGFILQYVWCSRYGYNSKSTTTQKKAIIEIYVLLGWY